KPGYLLGWLGSKIVCSAKQSHLIPTFKFEGRKSCGRVAQPFDFCPHRSGRVALSLLARGLTSADEGALQAARFRDPERRDQDNYSQSVIAPLSPLIFGRRTGPVEDANHPRHAPIACRQRVIRHCRSPRRGCSLAPTRRLGEGE